MSSGVTVDVVKNPITIFFLLDSTVVLTPLIVGSTSVYKTVVGVELENEMSVSSEAKSPPIDT